MQPQEVLDDRVTGVLGWQGNVSTGEGHIVPDYDMVVRLGFAGLRDKIQKHIDELDLSKPQDLEKLTFLPCLQGDYRRMSGLHKALLYFSRRAGRAV